MQTIRALIRYFGVYQVINIGSFGVDLLLLYFLQDFFSTTIAIGISFLLASILSYILHYKITFRTSSRSMVTGYWYFLFFATLRGLIIILSTNAVIAHSTLAILPARILAGTVVGTFGFFIDYYITFTMSQKKDTDSQ